MSALALLAAFFLFIGTLVIRFAGRAIGGRFPWRSRFALGGDFGDAMTHLLLVEKIRRNGHRIPRRTPEFMLAGPQDYPAFYHWVLSWVPKLALERFEWLFSPLVDALHAVLLFAAFFNNMNAAGHERILASVLMVLVWMLSPGLALEPRRGAFLNERVFGFLFANVYVGALGVWLISGRASMLLVALLAGCVVSVSSKFSMQVILFVTPLASLGLWDAKPIGVLLLLLLIAPIVTRGYALFVWKGSLRHSAFFARYMVHIGDYVTSFSMRQFLEAVHLLCKGKLRSACRLTLSHPISRVVINSPTAWVAIGLTWKNGGTPESYVWFVLTCATALVALATSTDTLKYLGEGERYMEVALAPSLLLIAAVSPDANFWFIALIVFSAIRLLMVWCSGAKTANAKLSGSLDAADLLAWLAKLPSQTIFAVPGRLAFPIAYAAPQHRHVWIFINVGERDRQHLFERLFVGGSRYPYPAPTQAYAIWEGHQADIAILHRQTADACKVAWGQDYDAIKGPQLFANNSYVVRGLSRNTEA
jgi:hypothetical protein